MRILELEIDRFGVWKDVNLPFAEEGVTVLYGPNEAGKSTLMRFVRGVLYGFQPADTRDAGRIQHDVFSSGSLRVRHHGRDHQLRRIAERGGRGRLEIDGKAVSDQDRLVQELRGELSESLFRDVFAIGLNELQQLATLHGDEVAEHVYGISLGREGEMLLHAQNRLNARANRLIDSGKTTGEIFRLTHKLAEADRDLQRVGQPHERYKRLSTQFETLEQETEDLKHRQRNLQDDLRGFQFLGRIWEPWKKEQQLRAQLDHLPASDIDSESLERLDQTENELAEILKQRQSLVSEIKGLLQHAKQLSVRPELEAEFCAIRRLNQLAPEFQKIEDSLAHQPGSQGDLESRVSELMSDLGDEWDVSEVDRADLSPMNLHELAAAAESRRSLERHRSRLAKKYQKLQSRLKDLEQANDRSGDSKNGQDGDRDHIVEAIGELEQLKELRQYKTHLQRAQDLFSQDRELKTVEVQLPPYFQPVLMFFAIAGLLLLICGAFGAIQGIVAGGVHAAMIGGCYALLGISTLGVCWTLRTHNSRRELPAAPYTELSEQTEDELANVDQQVQKILSRRILSRRRRGLDANADLSNPEAIDDALSALRRELHEFDRKRDISRKIQSYRKRLSRIRTNLQRLQKVVSQRRLRWRDALRQIGLDESLNRSSALIACDRIAKAKEFLDEQRTLNDRQTDRDRLAAYYNEIDELAVRLNESDSTNRNPYSLITEWDRELGLIAERRKERLRLRRMARQKRAELNKQKSLHKRLRKTQSSLLSHLGVSDRTEIDAILDANLERSEIERKLQELAAAISKIVETEPDLMIVEEQLIDYDETRCRTQIAEIEAELLQIDESLQKRYQSIGKVQYELEALKADRSVAELRFERSQIIDELKSAGQSFLAFRVADRVIELQRDQIERERQPEALHDASQFLQQLTCSNYQRIWTPLGEQLLMVDDAHGQSFRVEQLSSGTREQVFLALRLSMVRSFTRRGMEMPMVLDDVTVNFDQMRTEAAIETLLGVAASGQQIILLTCHLHMAHLFEQHQIEPVWLPANRPEVSV